MSVAVVSISLGLSSGLGISGPLAVVAVSTTVSTVSGVSTESRTVSGVSTESRTVSVAATVSGVAQTASVVAVVSIGLRLGLGFPLVEPSHLLEGGGRAGVQLADAVAGGGAHVGQGEAVAVVGIGVSTPLAVSAASVAGGLDAVSTDSRPGKLLAVSVSQVGVSLGLRGGEGGNSQTRGNLGERGVK